MWTRGTSPVFAPAFQPRGLGATPTSAKLAALAPGDAGIAQTLRYMRDFVRASLSDPLQRVRQQALGLTRNCPPQNAPGGWVAEVRVLHAFVRDSIRYTGDVEDYETVQSPEKTLEYGAGDCDDKVTLLSALLKSLSHPNQFVAVGIRGGPFSHVLLETPIGDHDVSCETILPRPLGWYPPDATSRYVLKV